MAIWRASVSDDTVAQWVNIDPKGESLLPAPQRPQVAAENAEGETVRANFEQPAGTAGPAAGNSPAPAAENSPGSAASPAPDNAPSTPPANPPTE